MATTRSVYDGRFYQSQGDESATSAAQVVPLANSLLAPTSVLDVGCGTGTWLAAWQQLGVQDIQGIDGAYVDIATLRIPREAFLDHDLTDSLNLGRKFDLVTSFETAEHLPKEAAATFIESLVRHSSTIMFSAAIPGQPGTDHVNCQWPSYWAGLFHTHGYEPVDIIRPQIWGNDSVASYYRQNILVFAAPDVLSNHPRQPLAFLDIVHPDVYSGFALLPLRKVVEKRLRSHNVRTRLRSQFRVLKARL